MFQYLMTYLNVYLRREEGQDLIEYALIIGLLVVAAIIGLAALGTEITALFDSITAWLSGVGAAIP